MGKQILWKAIEHSQSKLKGQHVILVAYQDMGSGQKKVVGIFPMYDLRDMNYDGSVSISERAWLGLTTFLDPYYVFGLINSLGQQSPIFEAARQLRDYQLLQKATSEFLAATFKVCQKALTTIMVEKALSPGIELNLANTGLANLRRFSDEAQFIVLTGLETVIIESICLTHK